MLKDALRRRDKEMIRNNESRIAGSRSEVVLRDARAMPRKRLLQFANPVQRAP
jgi:hypothetical protein